MPTVWYFVRHAGTIKPVPLASVMKFHAGEGPLPRASDGHVYLVEVTVEIENRKARSVSRILFAKTRALTNGHIDPGATARSMQLAVESLPWPSDDAKVVNAGHRFAQKRRQHENAWTPTDVELKLVHALINAKAKAVIIG